MNASFSYIFILYVCFASNAGLASNIDQDIRKITILQTSDIHSHIFDENGGWLRVGSLLKQIRKNAGGVDKTLLIDCGDSLVGTISSSITRILPDNRWRRRKQIVRTAATRSTMI